MRAFLEWIGRDVQKESVAELEASGLTWAQVAQQMRERGRRAWIFSAASNVASVRGLEKAGFQRRYSLVWQRTLGWQRIKGETPKYDQGPAAEVSARV